MPIREILIDRRVVARSGCGVVYRKPDSLILEPIGLPRVMAARPPNNIVSILSSTPGNEATRVLRGRVLNELWVRSGAQFDDDTVEVLLHCEDGSVARLRVRGRNAQVIAGRFGPDDQVVAHVHEQCDDGTLIAKAVAAR